MKRLFVETSAVLGPGQVLSSWDCRNKYLAVVGGNYRVRIYNRSGSVVTEFALISKNKVLHLDWDNKGETLAVSQENENVIVLYDISIRKLTKLNTDLKKVTWMAWNRDGGGNILSVGSSKGNLLLYDNLTFRKQLIMGKHSKKILFGAWNIANKLAMVGKDKVLTISDLSGSTLNENYLKQIPLDLQFGLQMSDENRKHNKEEEDTITMNMNGRTIYMFFINNPSQPIELAFQSKYGDILSYQWYGDGYILAGFSKGFIVSISTHEKEMGEEIHSLRLGYKSIVSICISPNKAQNMAAVSTASDIKIVDLNTFKENEHLSFIFDLDYGMPKKMSWTSDGQILCINTSNGNLLAYLVKTNKSINLQVFGEKNIAYLSSLQQISIVTDYLTIIPSKDAKEETNSKHSRSVQSKLGKQRLQTIDTSVEPKIITVGLQHVCVAFNNHCWCYTFGNRLLFEYDFISEIQDMVLNSSHLAVKIDDKIFIIKLSDTQQVGGVEPFVFSIKQEPISCFALSPFFLIAASKNGILHQMDLESHKAVNETKHTPNTEGSTDDDHDDNHRNLDQNTNEGNAHSVIQSVYPNHNGTITVFIDSSNHGHLYNPVTDTKLKITKFSPTISSIFWDQTHRTIFYGHDHSKNLIHSFVYNPQTLRGPTVEYIDVTSLNKGFCPILIKKGIVIGYVRDNIDKMEYHIVASFESLYEEAIGSGKYKTVPELLKLSQFSQSRRCFYQLMSLHFLRYAYFVSLRLKQRELWMALSKKCLELLDIDLAISVFRSLQNASNVLLLDRLKNEDDLYLVSGHCYTLLADFEMAQKLFLLSREPIWALQMRRDLLQFDRALELSEKLAPDQLPKICFEYAQQMEFRQKYQDSLSMYERAKRENEKMRMNEDDEKESGVDTNSHPVAAIQQCLSGIVRCTLRIGYIQKGVALAMSTKNKNLQLECGNLLQSMKQFDEAGHLFVHCGETTKAVNCFILSKNFEAVKPLITKISTPSLHIKYAKEMEMVKKYEDALRSYQIANDKLSVIRLYLYHLNEVDKAINVVRDDPFVEGAKLIATFTLNKRDIATSIEFLVMSRNFKKALEFATSYNEMDIYCDFLDQNHEFAEFQNIAEFYVTANDHQSAAKCFLKASLFEDALLHFIEDGIVRNLDDILGVIRECNDDDKLIDIVLDHIQSTDSDVNKEEIDKSTLFRLYLAIGDINLAIKMATQISAQNQRMGKYKDAHRILFEMVQELMQRGIAIKNKELTSNLFLLHSYILVRIAIKRGDDELSAKMLIRVCDSISKFPSHTVQLLTSAVIQCQKSGFYNQALEYSNYLMRPEYRKQIIPKYKKKIEGIVRHSYKQKRNNNDRDQTQKDPKFETSPCPFCKIEIPSTDLLCESCKNHIPYCIITGKHMVLDDWSYCPQCSFPALYSSFLGHVGKGLDCPMCQESITEDMISLSEDPQL